MRKNTKWTANEETLLESNYSQSTIHELRELFPKRTVRSISRKASNMGLNKEIETQRRIGRENAIKGYVDKFTHITKEVLIDLYVTEKLSSREVGARLGCSSDLVLNRLRGFGISIRERVGDPSFTVEERKEKWGRSLEQHNLWRGGVTPINESLRSATSEWRRNSMREHNFRCFITNKETHSLHVHHVIPFSEIRDEAIAELGLDKRGNVSGYTADEIEALKALITEKHEGLKGYPIDAGLHSLFHTLYGFKTDANDLNEFKTRYRLGEFDELTAVV